MQDVRFGKFKSKKSGYWYWQDNGSRRVGRLRQGTLGTKDEREAELLIHGMNQAHSLPSVGIHIARAYHQACDPEALARTWQTVINQILELKRGDTRYRWMIAMRDESFDSIRNVPLLKTRADHLLAVLQCGTVSTNVYLRRLHNFAVDMGWVLQPIIPKRQWPRIQHQQKRAITLEEHERIIERELNPERRAFYELCWHLGASQGDVASLHAEDIDWENQVVSYFRKKTKEAAQVHFGSAVRSVLVQLPKSGPLFPYLITVRPGDRATEFKQRCDGLGIEGVTLHSYRYAWAQRAKQCGYPERFAQQALGHNSKAVHRYYARTPIVRVPSLEDFEERAKKILPLPACCPAEATA